ncbi:acyl-CoA thioester hydrolase [Catenulispora sp. MAP12-49]|uniref:acyl-CoA thioesterase n=1 Tax=Catenulispora sp. MAP12-49 TaxID=3156302 RepID=UPI003518CDC5
MNPSAPTDVMPTSDVGVLIPVEVHFDELDPMSMLHNSRYQVWVERAWGEFWRGQGFGGESGFEGDGFHVVKAFSITYDLPVTGFEKRAVHLWMEHMGNASATAGFRVCSADGDITHAHGTRTVVRLDSLTFRPTPWSDRARETARLIEVPTPAL